MNIDKYRALMKVNGDDFRERQINIQKEGLNKQAMESPSYFLVDIEAKPRNEKRELIITNTSKGTVKDIIALPKAKNTIVAGDMIIWNKNKWLIKETSISKEVYTKGTMVLCNYELKWQDKSLNILNYPVVIESSSGTTMENNLLNIGVNQLVINIKYDENTMALKRGDRFFVDRNRINPKPYKIINIDNVRNIIDNHGYITLILEEDVINDKDSIEHMICDYTEVALKPIEGAKFCKIINEDDNIVCWDTYGCVLKAEFYDNGVVVNNLKPEWKVSAINLQYLNVEEVDNTLIIKCVNDSLVGSSVKIELSCKGDTTYSSDIISLSCISMF